MREWKIIEIFDECIEQYVWALEEREDRSCNTTRLCPVKYEDSWYQAVEMACIYMELCVEWRKNRDLYFSPFEIRDKAYALAGLPLAA